MKKFSKKVILASASPRRREILSEMGVEFDIMPSNIDEDDVIDASPSRLVKKLARAKAKPVADVYPAYTVIASDTVVARRGRIYGKPRDREDAFEMLSSLNGRVHKVYTGVCVVCNGESVTFCVASYVKFKKLSEQAIYRYIDECKPYDKAGAYGIQDKIIVEKYMGSYTNIVGLPEEKLAKVLRRVGVTDGND